jgi:hypothetical protein
MWLYRFIPHVRTKVITSVFGIIIRAMTMNHRGFSNISSYVTYKPRSDSISSSLDQIERILPIAGEHQKQQFSFLLTKQAYHRISDGHMQFSIFACPPSQQFTRVQRCTRCFVLLILSMFLNILYYNPSQAAVTVKEMTVGTMSITREHVSTWMGLISME